MATTATTPAINTHGGPLDRDERGDAGASPRVFRFVATKLILSEMTYCPVTDLTGEECLSFQLLTTIRRSIPGHGRLLGVTAEPISPGWVEELTASRRLEDQELCVY